MSNTPTASVRRSPSQKQITKASPLVQSKATPSGSVDLGMRVRSLRKSAGLTLRKLSERSGLSVSALSKIEHNQLSPTYDSLLSLANGLNIDIALLFADDDSAPGKARRSITRSDERMRYQTPNYDYELLCSDLLHKRMIPLVAHIKARDLQQFGPMLAHEGEEVIYVLGGRIILHTDSYAPTVLEAGDCVYFDSQMQHACTVEGVEDATVFWVCSSREAAPWTSSAG